MLDMQNGNILQRINSAALEFLEPLSLQQTYKTITHQAVKLVDGIDGAILLEEPGTNTLTPVYSSSSDYIDQLAKSKQAYKAFKKRVAVVAEHQDGLEEMVNGQHPGYRSVIFIPLFYQNKSLGTLLIRSNERDEFHENDLEVLKIFGSLATLAIRKAQLYQQNQSALKVRDAFISMATHELKTPLTSMMGYVQLLHSRIKDPASQEAGWIETLLIETRRLNELINQMMRTYTIKAGKLTFTWTECQLTEVITKTLTTFSANSDRKIEFNNQVKAEDDSIIGDCDKLQQVFGNILDNARKFSDSDEPITIDLYNDGAFLTVEILNKGQGIPKEELPHVFEEFYKGKSTETASGIGLGLYFVKTIVDQHHGKIQITSNKKGTRVIIRLKKAEI